MMTAKETLRRVIVVAAVATLFHAIPAQAQGLALRLEAANYNPTTGTWTDTSGNNNHATQSTVGYRPALVAGQTANGSAVVRFDGTDDFLNLTSDITTTAGDGYTVFIYLRRDAAATDAADAILVDDPVGSLVYDLNTGKPRVVQKQQAVIGTADTALGSTEFSNINVRSNNAGTAFRLNGADDGTAGGGTYGSVGYVGGRSVGTSQLHGDVAEIRLYNSQLAAGEIAAVEAELEAAYASAPATPGTLIYGK